MKKIKIVSGAYGYHPAGAASVKLITAESGPIDVSDTEAARLVRMNVAVIVSETDDAAQEARDKAVATAAETSADTAPCVNMDETESAAEGQETPRLDAEQLKELTNAKLRELAEDMGIDCSKLRTKAQLIAAICDEPLEDCIVEADEPPVLEAGVPVV